MQTDFHSSPAPFDYSDPSFSPPGYLSGPLIGRTALVAGADFTVISTVALALGQSGATVYLCLASCPGKPDQTHKLNRVAGLVSRSGGKGIPIMCRSVSEKELEPVIDRVMANQGRLDIMINIISPGPERPASVGRRSPAWRCSSDAWSGQISSGLAAAHAAIACSAREMIAFRKGLIVNICPSRTDDPAVSALSAAHQALTAQMGVELAAYNLTVLSLDLGRSSGLDHIFYHRLENRDDDVQLAARALAGLAAASDRGRINGLSLTTAQLFQALSRPDFVPTVAMS